MNNTTKWLMGIAASIFMLLLSTLIGIAGYEYKHVRERLEAHEEQRVENTAAITTIQMDVKYIKEAIMRLEVTSAMRKPL